MLMNKVLHGSSPADELIEKPDGAVSPCVVFVDELVREVFVPTSLMSSLYLTAETYYSGPAPICRATPSIVSS